MTPGSGIEKRFKSPKTRQINLKVERVSLMRKGELGFVECPICEKDMMDYTSKKLIVGKDGKHAAYKCLNVCFCGAVLTYVESKEPK